MAPWKKFLLGMVLAVLLLAAACTSAGVGEETSPGEETPPSEVGETSTSEAEAAPGFEIEVFGNASYAKGERVGLSDFEGMPVVINFWYPSCPPCRLEMPDFEAASVKHRGDVVFLGVQLLGLDSVQDGQDFVDEFGITYAIGPDADGSIVIDYNVIGFPTSVFLDRDHNISRKWSGALNAEKLEELVQGLLQ